MKSSLLLLSFITIYCGCDHKPEGELESKQEFKEEKPKMEIVDTYDKNAHKTKDDDHPDAKVIKQLIEAGANLEKPHKPDFQFDFKEVEDARNVAKLLLKEGFESKIYAPQEGFPTYELISQKEMIITFEKMSKLTDYLRKVAEENNGEMTGWGTSVEK